MVRQKYIFRECVFLSAFLYEMITLQSVVSVLHQTDIGGKFTASKVYWQTLSLNHPNFKRESDIVLEDTENKRNLLFKFQ